MGERQIEGWVVPLPVSLSLYFSLSLSHGSMSKRDPEGEGEETHGEGHTHGEIQRDAADKRRERHKGSVARTRERAGD